MDEEKLVAAINAIGDALRTEVSSQIAKLDEKCSALADSMVKMKADAEEENENDLAQRVAADRTPIAP